MRKRPISGRNVDDKKQSGDLLKYPRRTKRIIDEIEYRLKEPSANTSKKLRKIKSTGTTIEKLFEKALTEAGIYFTKPDLLIERLEGNPDFVLPKYRIVIFCDGDFWHGYNFNGQIKGNNKDFWEAKIRHNISHDKAVNELLQKNGWSVFRFWEHEITSDVSECIMTLRAAIRSQARKAKTHFTFVDLFAGIGGFRIPLEELGGKCMGFSEIDRSAIEIYKLNFIGERDSDEIELGSVTNLGKLPFDNLDLVVGGVPCQSWSVAGKMKGFEDPRGQWWYDSIRIVELNKPRAFIFENVKGLYDPRNKENLDFLKKKFSKLNYSVKVSLLNSYDFGLPQNRDRVFIVGIRNDIKNGEEFTFPKPINKKSFLYDLITDVKVDKEIDKTKFDPKELFGDKVPMSRNRFQKLNELNDFFIFCDTRNGHTTIHSWDIIRTSPREKNICMVILRNRRKKVYGNSDGNPLSFYNLKTLIPDLREEELNLLVKKRILRKVDGDLFALVNSKNSAGINGIYRIYLPHSNIFSTLTATGTKDYVALKAISADSPMSYKELFLREIIKKKAFRPITPQEAGKLQGFPAWFSTHKNSQIAHKQFGNAVSTSVVYHVAKSLLSTGKLSSVSLVYIDSLNNNNQITREMPDAVNTLPPSEKDQIIEKFKAWFRDSLIESHRKNTIKLKDINEFQINPFLLYYLANYLEGNSDPVSLAKALVYPRVLGTSITTSFGTRMQGEFITQVLGAYGSSIPGIDIEFDDKIDGRKKYCQLKSGPNALNRADVTTYKNYFKELKNRARTNQLEVHLEDMLFCLTYGEPDEKNAFIKELEEEYIVYIGREFWYHFTGDNNFYQRIIMAAGEVAREIDMKNIVDEVITDLSKTIEEKFNTLASDKVEAVTQTKEKRKKSSK